VLAWYAPASSAYSKPVPVGLVTLTIAWLKPSEQSTVCTGLEGVGGCASITTLADDAEVHPEVLVTVKIYVPVARPDIVVLVPDPLVVTAPGLRVNVHVPLEGNPLSTTLPVETMHVGWVIVPTTGADGVTGCALITTLDDDVEVHPSEFVTVYV
jgi:hypothetical protein